MNEMLLKQLGKRAVSCLFSRTHRREKLRGLRNRPRMPGAINLPPPGVRRLAPAFNHHRKIGLLVQYEVHATEYKTKWVGSRVNAYCQTCQLTGVLSFAHNTDGEVWGRPGPGWPLFRVWVGWHGLGPGCTYHPRATRVSADGRVAEGPSGPLAL